MESLRLYVRCSLLKEPFLFVVRNPTAVTLKTLIKQLEHVISEQYGAPPSRLVLNGLLALLLCWR